MILAAANAVLNSTKTKRSWRHVVIAFTAVVGLISSFGLYDAIGGWQAHVRDVGFSGRASNYLQAINTGLKDATDLLYPIRAYIESLDHQITSAEFQAFSHSLRGRVPGLRDTGWAPRVSAADRETFERAVHAAGEPAFQIKQRGATGQLVRASDRPEYFPILYSEPGQINRPVMGFDVASEPMRRQAIGRALATDRPAATPRVTLMNADRPNGGIMSFIPVYGKAGPGDAEPPVAGVVLGAFETAAMIDNVLTAKARLNRLDMYVFDPAGAAGDRLIYWHSADGRPAPAETSLMAMQHFEGTLELVDQRWQVILTPSDAAAESIADWSAVMVLIAGLAMTGGIVAYLWFSHRRTLRLERLTADLHATTEQLRRNSVELDHIARHDVLTGLANRMAFRDEVASALRRARRGQGMAVLYLDLDRFKAVNDTLGHPAGDRLLCEVADRLRDTVREADTITRLGGDEFAILQTGAGQPDASETLARRVIDRLSQPYLISGQIVVIGVSVGVTLAEGDGMDVDQLLRRADMALYTAKREGRGTWRFFVDAMDIEAQARRGLEMDLRHALDNDELELYYQPQVTLSDGVVRGFEALLRWHHPSRGMVMPGDFIRCAEDAGLIVPIGTWLLQTALRQASQWPRDVRVAVNLSAQQIARDDLVQTIKSALAAYGQTGDRLELEVTENALIDQHVGAHAALKQLQAIGVWVSMDDFGTGYSSLSHLRSFPFDRVKVDQSFVAAMSDSPQGNAVVRAILQLANTLDISTVAEGVETQAQLDELAAMGCQAAQGYLFSPAQPASAVLGLLANFPPITLPERGPARDGGRADARSRRSLA